MYFIKDVFRNADPAVPDIIYKIEPYIKNNFDIDLNRLLLNEQEEIISKLSQLLVKLHNITHNLPIKSEIKQNYFTENNKNDLQTAQNTLFQRLQSIDKLIDKTAFEKGIIVNNFTNFNVFDEEQTNLWKSISILDEKVNKSLSDNKIKLSSNKNGVINICVHANPLRPPFSLFMMLARLRAVGYRVACICQASSKLKSLNWCSFKKYIDLFIDFGEKPRKNFDLIVTIVWKDCVVSDSMLISNVYNDSPLFGELMCLSAVCLLMHIDISGVFDGMKTMNEQLRGGSNVKAALNSLNNKFYKDINRNSEGNVAFGAFVVSSLIQDGHKMSEKKLKLAVDHFVEGCSYFDIDQFVL